MGASIIRQHSRCAGPAGRPPWAQTARSLTSAGCESVRSSVARSRHPASAKSGSCSPAGKRPWVRGWLGRPASGPALRPNSPPYTCSSTTAPQQRVRFLTMLLGSPRVARELQSWLRFLPSVETGERARDRGSPSAQGSPDQGEPWGLSPP